MHELLIPFIKFLGKYKGKGTGVYPTIQTFHYEEDCQFSLVNPAKPMLSYHQTRTYLIEKQIGAHVEFAYIRILPNQKIEFCITQPTGVCEIDEGIYNIKNDVLQIEVSSKEITRTSSAKPPHVTQVKRIWTLDASQQKLEYSMAMATTTTPELTHHLQASLALLDGNK